MASGPELTVPRLRKPVRRGSRLRREAVDKGPATHLPSLAPAHLHVIGREDAQPAMVFPLQPVLVHLLVDVNDVTLLQSQLPANQTKNVSKLRSSPFSFRSGPVQHSQSPGLPPGMPTAALPSPLPQPPSAGPAPGGREGEPTLTWGTVPGSQT